ncbi:MAG: transporter substrate-binding domain-containing protein [Kiloniellales bacterium]
MRQVLVGFVVVVAMSLTLGAAAQAADRIVVTTLDWPPYTGDALPKEGATTEVVRQVFEAAGIDVEVEILPWKRAIAMAKNDDVAVAYFPGYHCRHVEGFVASDPIGTGPLGLAEHVDNPVTWSSIDDLGEQKLKIGTVLGYANTDEFDEKAGTGWIQAIAAKDDLTNLKKLLRQRIDAAVIDKLVLSYLLATEPALKGKADTIKFDEKPLDVKTLYLCFVNDEQGMTLRDTFNQALKTADIEAILNAYFENEF